MPEPPVADADAAPMARATGGRAGRLLPLTASLVAALTVAAVVALWPNDPFGPGPAPGGSATAASSGPGGTATGGTTAERDSALRLLLADRSAALLAGDRSGWLAAVDPAQEGFYRAQEQVFDRLRGIPFSQWEYTLVGTGPPLPATVEATLPDGAAIMQVRLTFQIADTATRTDRQLYWTFLPRGGRWLLAGDTDGEPQGLASDRDLWDLGPVRLFRGRAATLLVDPRSQLAGTAARLVREADRAVAAVDRVWRDGDEGTEWPRRPVLLVPADQGDMATLLGHVGGGGLGQIAAVTTGEFQDGLSRGDRVVLNPEAFGTLGATGRRVVLTHEMTHVAVRASTVVTPPAWLSEGFADYVAYRANPVPLSVVAGDVIAQVRRGRLPRELPDQADFGTDRANLASAYEQSWLACRLIAERYGARTLVRLYRAMTDSAGSGWPEESQPVLGITAEQFTRQWQAYLEEVAAA